MFLVVGDDEGGRLRHRLVDGDDDDTGLGGFLKACLDAGRIGRVDDNGVHLGADQVADVLELAGGVGVAVGDVELRHLA